MGRKKKKNFKKELIDVLWGVAVIILIVVISKTGILKKIDDMAAETGLVEHFEEIKNANRVTGQEVKENSNIISSVAENIKIDNSKLNILFLNVGQADSELIIANGKTMLIDAGNKNDGELLVNAIKGLGIEKIDYVIGTHVHEDHIGGMSYIIDSFDIGEFYLPYNTTSTTTYYKNLLTSLTQKNIGINEASVGDVISLGNAKCEIMAVRNDEPENINEESIVIELEYGNLKYLFMGDAEASNEKLRKWNDIDVLKVGHHGSNTSSSQEFLNQILPEISIISVGKDNSYGLPKDKIVQRLKNIGSTIYRTDESGTIQILSDGNINEVITINLNFDGSET